MESETSNPDCYKNLRSKWIKSTDPRKIITDGDIDTTSIKHSGNLSLRLFYDDVFSMCKTNEWIFKIDTDGLYN